MGCYFTAMLFRKNIIHRLCDTDVVYYNYLKTPAVFCRREYFVVLINIDRHLWLQPYATNYNIAWLYLNLLT